MDAMVSQQRKFGIGQAPKRVEDQRFLTGAGRYTGDMIPEGALMAQVLRASHAHARFTLSGLEEARAMPGVAAILTHADVADLGALPCPGAVKNSDGSKMPVPPYPVLASDVARHVGDALAFIVAETADQACDAAEAVMVDYEPLEPVVGIEGARAQGASLVWPGVRHQPRLRFASRRCIENRESLREGPSHDRARHRQQPAHRQFHGAARLYSRNMMARMRAGR